MQYSAHCTCVEFPFRSGTFFGTVETRPAAPLPYLPTTSPGFVVHFACLWLWRSRHRSAVERGTVGKPSKSYDRRKQKERVTWG